MSKQYDAVVVGGGVGGIVSAIRLAVAGRSVALYERNEHLGGKLAIRERDGFTFDIGPSLLTLPSVFDEVFRLAGTSLEAEVQLVRLDPSFRYFWPDASTVTFRDEPVATAEALDAFSPGSGAEYLAYLRRARSIWQTSERTFFAGAMGSPVSLLRRVRSPRDFARIDARRRLASRSASAFTNTIEASTCSSPTLTPVTRRRVAVTSVTSRPVYITTPHRSATRTSASRNAPRPPRTYHAPKSASTAAMQPSVAGASVGSDPL